MRYTISGGKGYVAENAAWQGTTGTIDPFKAISSLNWVMVCARAGVQLNLNVLINSS